MTLIVENANDDLLKLIKSAVKLAGATLRTKQESSKLESAIDEAKIAKNEYLEGKRKGFDSIKALKMDLLK